MGVTFGVKDVKGRKDEAAAPGEDIKVFYALITICSRKIWIMNDHSQSKRDAPSPFGAFAAWAHGSGGAHFTIHRLSLRAPTSEILPSHYHPISA